MNVGMNAGMINPLDFTKLVTTVEDVTKAQQLPCGAAVGDTCGGRSFSDNVAAVLEARSFGGWREVQDGEHRWTVIVLAK